MTSKSDPQVWVFIHDSRTSQWNGTPTILSFELISKELGKTEMIKDNLNPKFATSVVVDYYFEEVQQLRFTVVDVDKPNGKLKDQVHL